jgi:CRP-like cAMP-binding protein
MKAETIVALAIQALPASPKMRRRCQPRADRAAPGRLMGEFGFLTLDNRQTATIECIEDGHILTISCEKLLEICFQNPQFGYYFLVRPEGQGRRQIPGPTRE